MRTTIQDGKGKPVAGYSLEGLNIKGDVGLDRILEAVRNFQKERERGVPSRQADRPRMNLLLWGPPGTGKTEYVKYLGAELKSKVVVKMGSDLLDKYVGGTEQRIADAFAEAEAEKAILFLDEIDGLLQSRTRADHSWEVTQVNELLHQMENFGGVMVGATNFFDSLDQAVLRRFTFKIEFGYLDDAGKRKFFERTFGAKLSESERSRLDAVANLAPGDFRTVRQSLYYLGSGVDNAMRIGELEKESGVKSATKRHRIGF
jgi:SpoVK/Ycf46/Vps4 family AAA+-type ATPase